MVQYATSVPPAINLNHGNHDGLSVAGSVSGSTASRNLENNTQVNDHQSLSIMGDRNEQASLRSRNSNNN